VRLHEAEADIDVGLVERLVSDQFPGLLGTVRPVPSTGTVNEIYRLGDELYARLPRIDDRDLVKEWEWLPRLAPRLPLRIPAPVALGEPGHGYPYRWGVYEWIEGVPYADGVDEEQAARDLAGFVRALRSLPVEGGPPAGRAPLAELDQVTRAAISDPRVLAAWEEAVRAPQWDGRPSWIHCDLLRPNVLVRDSRICAVIDFGSVGVGDPASDLTAAWALFGPAGRAVYRAELGVDEGTWARGRGIALHQAAMIIPYYATTNPAFVLLAQRTVEQILIERLSKSGA
jgi:aminoglycoside phosphotransferase (APT) family kinase protein